VGAVLPHVAADIYDGYTRLRALETQSSIEDFRRLMVGFKRVYNITKTLRDVLPPDPAAFSQQEERALHDLFEERKDEFSRDMEARRYPEAIGVLGPGQLGPDRTGGRLGHVGEKNASAAATTCSISRGPWASDTKPVSNCDGARYTPPSSAARKKAPKRSRSLLRALS